jgi:hypothetical protein
MHAQQSVPRREKRQRKLTRSAPFLPAFLEPGERKLLCVYHSNHFLKEYIPKEKLVGPLDARSPV